MLVLWMTLLLLTVRGAFALFGNLLVLFFENSKSRVRDGSRDFTSTGLDGDDGAAPQVPSLCRYVCTVGHWYYCTGWRPPVPGVWTPPLFFSH